MGSVAGRKFLALPYYSQRAVFAFLLALFSLHVCFRTKCGNVLATVSQVAVTVQVAAYYRRQQCVHEA